MFYEDGDTTGDGTTGGGTTGGDTTGGDTTGGDTTGGGTIGGGTIGGDTTGGDTTGGGTIGGGKLTYCDADGINRLKTDLTNAPSSTTNDKYYITALINAFTKYCDVFNTIYTKTFDPDPSGDTMGLYKKLSNGDIFVNVQDAYNNLSPNLQKIFNPYGEHIYDKICSSWGIYDEDISICEYTNKIFDLKY